MCLLTETRALSAQGEKRALVGNLTMPLRDVSARAEVCRNTLVDFTGEEVFEAADDLASGPAASRPAGDVVWCNKAAEAS